MQKKFAEDEEEKKAEEVPVSNPVMQAASSAPIVFENIVVEEEDRNLSAEEMNSDDLGGELNASDSEDGLQERVMRREFKGNLRAVKNEKTNVYR